MNNYNFKEAETPKFQESKPADMMKLQVNYLAWLSGMRLSRI